MVQSICQVTKSIIGCVKSVLVWGHWWGLYISTFRVRRGVVRHPWPTTLSIRYTLLFRNHVLIGATLGSRCLPFNWDAAWSKRELVLMHLFKVGILWNMAGGNAQSLACGCSPGPLWVKAKGIKEVFDSQRSHIRTFVQPNPITFPGINAPEGLFCCPCGPECSTEGHCHPWRSQRHIETGKPLDSASTGWGECSNTRQHTYQFEWNLRTLSAIRRRLCRSTTMRCSLRTLGALSSSVI